MSRLRHLAAAAALGAAAAVGGVGASAAPAAAASTCEGVWVVVDASAIGGATTVRCASGNPASGLDALVGAGHAYSFVPNLPGMVCIIDGRPATCNGAPSDAYWSYWYAQAGGSWTYSQRGAATRDPQPGSVEGWAFGAGDPPSVAPPAPPEPDPDPDPEPEPTAKSTPDTEARPEPEPQAGPRAGTGTGSSSGGSPGPPARDDGDGTLQGATDAGTSGDEADGALHPEAPERDRRHLGDLAPGDPRLPRLAADRGSSTGRREIAAPDAPVSTSGRLDDAEVAVPEQPPEAGAPRWTLGVLLIGSILGGAVLQQRRRRVGSGG